jgi:nucleoside-diphosphate-sugar epimerase
MTEGASVEKVLILGVTGMLGHALLRELGGRPDGP